MIRYHAGDGSAKSLTESAGGMIVNADLEQVQPQNGAETSPATLIRPIVSDDFDRDVWSVFGLPIDLLTAPQAVEAIEISTRDRRRLSFVTPNVNFLIRCIEDPKARREVIDSDLSLVDGAPLVALGRLAGVPIKERCAGSDVFAALRLRPGFPGRRLRVFFFGGRIGAAKAAAEAVTLEGRGVEAAGYLDPGHGDLDSMSGPEIINEINASNADFIVVALGAAKGQRWIDQNRNKLDAPVIAHLGAVVDFVAGTVRRAPPVFSRIGLEWAWRIKEEPALWRRYWRDASALAQLAPRLIWSALNTRSASAGNGTCRAHFEDRQTVIEFNGVLSVNNRDKARAVFRSAAERNRDVVLDLNGLRNVDASILGLLLMLEKNTRVRGRKITVRNQSAQMKRLLAAHAMKFPGTKDENFGSNAERESIAAAG